MIAFVYLVNDVIALIISFWDGASDLCEIIWVEDISFLELLSPSIIWSLFAK